MDDVIGQRAWNKLAARRQCSATSKQTGERCRRAPIVGGFVCDMHGGKNPAVQQSARERLLAMVDPALDALLRALQTGPPCEHCGRTDVDRDPVVLRAAQLVLDRAGYHPTLTVEHAGQHDELQGLNICEVAERAEEIARAARAMADEEAARLLPDVTDAMLLDDAFTISEDEPIPSADVDIHVGNDTADESKEPK